MLEFNISLLISDPLQLKFIPLHTIKRNLSNLCHIRPYKEFFNGRYLRVGCELRTLKKWLETSSSEMKNLHGSLAVKYLPILQYRIKNKLICKHITKYKLGEEVEHSLVFPQLKGTITSVGEDSLGFLYIIDKKIILREEYIK